jgi:hypothetical protein
MRAHEIITESINNAPLVVVDVQPAYANAFNFESELATLLNNRTGETLMYVNAEDTYTIEDTVDDIRHWWIESGMDEDVAYDLEFYDKGYGNLREATDSGADDADIIAVLREMFRQNINDSRMLFDEDAEKQQEVFGEENMYWIDAGISIMELNGYDNLKRMSPFYLCGGGRDECLKEVMLMCNALNIKYKLLKKFIY